MNSVARLGSKRDVPTHRAAKHVLGEKSVQQKFVRQKARRKPVLRASGRHPARQLPRGTTKNTTKKKCRSAEVRIPEGKTTDLSVLSMLGARRTATGRAGQKQTACTPRSTVGVQSTFVTARRVDDRAGSTAKHVDSAPPADHCRQVVPKHTRGPICRLSTTNGVETGFRVRRIFPQS